MFPYYNSFFLASETPLPSYVCSRALHKVGEEHRELPTVSRDWTGDILSHPHLLFIYWVGILKTWFSKKRFSWKQSELSM